MPQTQPGGGWGSVPQPQPQPGLQPTTPTTPTGLGWGWPGTQQNLPGRYETYYPTRPNPTDLPANTPNPADVQPTQELPPPIPEFSPQAKITFRNPADTDVPARYWLNGQKFEMPPGHKHELPAELVKTIEFDRGGAFGRQEYSVRAGEYCFTPTHQGWEVYRTSGE